MLKGLNISRGISSAPLSHLELPCNVFNKSISKGSIRTGNSLSSSCSSFLYLKCIDFLARNVQFAAVITAKRAELMDMGSESLCLSTRVEHNQSFTWLHQQTPLFSSDPELTEVIAELKPNRNRSEIIRKQSPLIPVQTFQGLEAHLALMPVAY